jgi:hypothetical protein
MVGLAPTRIQDDSSTTTTVVHYNFLPRPCCGSQKPAWGSSRTFSSPIAFCLTLLRRWPSGGHGHVASCIPGIFLHCTNEKPLHRGGHRELRCIDMESLGRLPVRADITLHQLVTCPPVILESGILIITEASKPTDHVTIRSRVSPRPAKQRKVHAITHGHVSISTRGLFGTVQCRRQSALASNNTQLPTSPVS